MQKFFKMFSHNEQYPLNSMSLQLETHQGFFAYAKIAF